MITTTNYKLHLLLNTFLRMCFICIVTAVILAGITGTRVYAEETDGYVSQHGQLSVSGDGVLVDSLGEPYQLKGISTHNVSWYPEYISEETFSTLKDSLGVNAVRIAMYSSENGGYCSSDDSNRTSLINKVKEGINAALDLDLYVIVDWHILSDGNPNTNKEAAMSFFENISSAYGSCPNILYEICNEPNGGTTWDDISSYASDVIGCIRYYSPESIIIVGTPNWSQDVDIASAAMLDYENVMYSLHFYAATHKQELQDKLLTALDNKLPVFVTEFGITEASGNGTIDIESANTWISMLNYYNISYFYWNLSNKDEACALLKPSCELTDNWTTDDYTESGKWYYELLNSEEESMLPAYTPASSNTLPTTAAASTAAPASSVWDFNNGLRVTSTCTSVWSDNEGSYASYDIVIANNASTDVSSWRLRMSWGSDITPKEYWSCDVGGTGNSRLFVPTDYNTIIPSNGTISFGIIVCSKDAPILNSVSFE